MNTKLSQWILALFLCALGSTSANAVAGPAEQVQQTVDSILSTLTDESLDQDAKRSKISSLIRQRFDFRAMSQRTLATNWKKATSEEKERFMELFADLLEHTYMGRIEAYTDERVKYVGEKIEKRRALVDTLIVTANVEIPINYKLTQKGEQWLVYDVVIEEVSLIRNYRNTYREIVKKEGIGGLLAKMEKKVDEQRNKSKAAS